MKISFGVYDENGNKITETSYLEKDITIVASSDYTIDKLNAYYPWDKSRRYNVPIPKSYSENEVTVGAEQPDVLYGFAITYNPPKGIPKNMGEYRAKYFTIVDHLPKLNNKVIGKLGKMDRAWNPWEKYWDVDYEKGIAKITLPASRLESFYMSNDLEGALLPWDYEGVKLEYKGMENYRDPVTSDVENVRYYESEKIINNADFYKSFKDNLEDAKLDVNDENFIDNSEATATFKSSIRPNGNYELRKTRVYDTSASPGNIGTGEYSKYKYDLNFSKFVYYNDSNFYKSDTLNKISESKEEDTSYWKLDSYSWTDYKDDSKTTLNSISDIVSIDGNEKSDFTQNSNKGLCLKSIQIKGAESYIPDAAKSGTDPEKAYSNFEEINENLKTNGA